MSWPTKKTPKKKNSGMISRLAVRGHRPWAVAFFLVFLAVSLLVLDDYGVSMDEAMQRDHGRVMLTWWSDRLGVTPHRLDKLYRAMPAYGMFMPATTLSFEIILGLQESQFAYFRLRHLLQFLLFFGACVAFYRLLRYRWPERKWIPLLGSAMLVLSPRIFAHAFFDPKDEVMLSLYTIATYTLVRFLTRRTTESLLWHAVATGIVLGSRQASVLIPMATLALVAYQAVLEPQLRSKAWQLVPYAALSLVLGVFWNPYLYMGKGDGLARSLANVTDYVQWDGMVLFAGEILNPGTIPWYYLPQWIGLTTPLVYLPLGLTGAILVTRRLFRALGHLRLYASTTERTDLLIFALTLLPLAAAILLEARLYQGWRHLFFIYPGFIYLAVLGYTYYSRPWPRWTAGFVASGMLLTLLTMIRIHPHQQVYFNESVWYGPSLLDQYELDFWGVSYRTAFEELARTIPSGERRLVKCHGWACMTNLRALPPDIIDRFQETENWDAKGYFATEFYYPTHREFARERKDIFAHPVVEVAPDGHLIIGIYPGQLK